VGPPHLAHPALAKQREKAVPPEHLFVTGYLSCVSTARQRAPSDAVPFR
jgi:hypothetical protein